MHRGEKGGPFTMNPTTEQARAAILLDPHPLWLGVTEKLLASLDVEVVGSTTEPSEALALLREHRPGLAIIAPEADDGELDGMTVIEQASAESPGTKILVLSGVNDAETIETALDLGASAYILKSAVAEDIAAVVRQAFGTSVFVGSRPRPDEALLAQIGGNGNGNSPNDPGLTRRELEILRLVAEGSSNAQLAQMLWLSEQTVKFHLSNIYRKLGVANRTEASRWAQLHGLLPRRVAKVGA